MITSLKAYANATNVAQSMHRFTFFLALLAIPRDAKIYRAERIIRYAFFLDPHIGNESAIMP